MWFLIQNFFILIVCIAAGISFGRDIELTNAFNGWAPPSLVWATDSSLKILEKDFFGKQNLHILNSLVMWVYPVSNSIFGFDPTFTQKIVIIISCIIYAFSLITLFNSLFPGAPAGALIGAVSLAVLTMTVDGDFGRFGQGNFSLGQYYAFAVALQMIVVALAMRGELIKCSLCLSLLIWIHPLIAFITGFVAGIVLLVPNPRFKLWKKYLFCLILLICSALLYLVLQRGNSPKHIMAFEEWIDWVRFLNYHWFPFQLGIFTRENEIRISPFFVNMLLAFGCISKESFPVETIQKWFAALAAGFFLTLVGLLNSVFPVSMFLTMASLHRASGLILLLTLPFACLALYNAVKNGGVIGVLAVVIFASPFLGSYGFPVLPAIMLLFAVQPFLMRYSKVRRSLLKALCVFVAGMAFANSLWLILRLGISPLAPSLVGSSIAWILGGIYGIIYYALKSTHQSNSIIQKVPLYFLRTTFLLLIAFKIQDIWKRHPLVENRSLAENYLEVQKWAQTKTPPGSLFMTDPTHCYGWKDYSARPSWGNFRDWIHSSICYRADADLFNEGLRRARRLGVDPKAYLDRAKALGDVTVSGKCYSDLSSDLKTAYYSLNKETARQLAGAEKIDFFVFQKESAPKLSNEPAFANASFVVYRAR